jgi:hypothetical protein
MTTDELLAKLAENGGNIAAIEDTERKKREMESKGPLSLELKEAEQKDDSSKKNNGTNKKTTSERGSLSNSIAHNEGYSTTKIMSPEMIDSLYGTEGGGNARDIARSMVNEAFDQGPVTFTPNTIAPEQFSSTSLKNSYLRDSLPTHRAATIAESVKNSLGRLDPKAARYWVENFTKNYDDMMNKAVDTNDQRLATALANLGKREETNLTNRQRTKEWNATTLNAALSTNAQIENDYNKNRADGMLKTATDIANTLKYQDAGNFGDSMSQSSSFGTGTTESSSGTTKKSSTSTDKAGNNQYYERSPGAILSKFQEDLRDIASKDYGDNFPRWTEEGKESINQYFAATQILGLTSEEAIRKVLARPPGLIDYWTGRDESFIMGFSNEDSGTNLEFEAAIDDVLDQPGMQAVLSGDGTILSKDEFKDYIKHPIMIVPPGSENPLFFKNASNLVEYVKSKIAAVELLDDGTPGKEETLKSLNTQLMNAIKLADKKK